MTTGPATRPTIRQRLRHWAASLKRDVLALYLAARDPRVPWFAKAAALVVAGYALSPIDLIPDFIPVLGYLDDLILVPLGIWLTIKLIPAPVLADLRERAERQLIEKPRSWVAAVCIVAIWLAALAATAWLLWPPL
ncbi:MAG: YkvA family protein [Rhodospirillales bacterium]